MDKNDKNRKKLNEDWAYLSDAISDIELQSSDVEFNRQYKNRGLKASIEEKKLNKTNASDDAYNQSILAEEEERIYEEIEKQSQRLIRKKIDQDNQKKRKKINFQAKISSGSNISTLTRAKAQVINRQIMFWSSYVWLFVQVPFAVFLILLFSIVGGATSVDNSDNFLASTLIKLLGWLSSAIGLKSTIEAFFFITWLIIIVIAFILIFTVFTQHTLANNKPLSGRASGLKLGALLLVFIGYSVPVLNILPWILIWIFVIGKYPK